MNKLLPILLVVALSGCGGEVKTTLEKCADENYYYKQHSAIKNQISERYKREIERVGEVCLRGDFEIDSQKKSLFVLLGGSDKPSYYQSVIRNNIDEFFTILRCHDRKENYKGNRYYFVNPITGGTVHAYEDSFYSDHADAWYKYFIYERDLSYKLNAFKEYETYFKSCENAQNKHPKTFDFKWKDRDIINIID